MSVGTPAIVKTLRILELAAAREAPSSTVRLARLAKMSASTCYRAVSTLKAEGWLRALEDRLVPDSKFIEVAQACAGVETRTVLIQAVLDDLAADCGLSAKYSLRYGDQAVTRQRATGAGEFALGGRSGAAFTIAVGSSGAALLADAEEAELTTLAREAPEIAWAHQTAEEFKERVRMGRTLGVFRDFGSYRPSVHSLSVPVRRADGRIEGALTLLGMPEDFEGAAVERHLNSLKAAAARLAVVAEGET